MVARLQDEGYIRSPEVAAAFGIPARAGRTATLMDLAAQMPAVVLSKLLGISLATATGWNQAAGSTQAGYAAEVARRQHRS